MLSIRLKPELESLLVERARREGVTKSKLVNDLLARALLPAPDPFALLETIRRDTPGEDPQASEHIGAKLKAKLRAPRAA
jgi:hypothetical protein